MLYDHSFETTSPSYSASRAYDIIKKWNLKFSGARGNDARRFLFKLKKVVHLFPYQTRIYFVVCRFSSRALPCIDKSRKTRHSWRSWGEFVFVWRSRFGDPDYAFGDEARRRTQNEHEPVAEYLTCLQALFDRMSPPWPLAEQLTCAYRNLLPRLQISINRDDFFDFVSGAVGD